MIRAMSAIAVAHLDSPTPIARDDAFFSANLATMRVTQPDIASWLEAAGDGGWFRTHGLDGSVTAARKTDAGVEWLDRTPIPVTRAHATLRNVAAGDRNYALATPGSGAEIELLLSRFATHQALFVIADDPSRVRAILALRDHASDIRRARLLFVQAPRMQDELLSMLRTHEGLLVPAALLATPPTDADWTRRVTAALQHVAAQIGTERATAADALRIRPPAPDRTTRVAVLALQPDSTDHALAVRLTEELSHAGIAAMLAALDGPLHAHSRVHERAIAAFAPTITLAINHPPMFSATANARKFRWQVALPTANESFDPTILTFAGTPTVEQQLLQHGVRRDRTRPAYIGPPTAVLDRDVAPVDASCVAIVGDWINDDAAAAGIRQPTHRQLWQHARDLLDRGAIGENDLGGAALLKIAQREQRVTIDEPSIRDEFVAALDNILIPAWATRATATALQTTGARLLAIGKGWNARLAKPNFEHHATLDAMERLNTRPRLAVVTHWRDPLAPAAVWSAGLGWPLLFVGVARRIHAAVKPILRESDLLITAAPTQLPTLLARDATHARRAESARAHLASRQDLAQFVKLIREL